MSRRFLNSLFSRRNAERGRNFGDKVVVGFGLRSGSEIMTLASLSRCRRGIPYKGPALKPHLLLTCLLLFFNSIHLSYNLVLPYPFLFLVSIFFVT